jgi:hypothetical protein
MRIMRSSSGGQPPAATQILAICVLLNKLMKTDVWALVGIVVMTIQICVLLNKLMKTDVWALVGIVVMTIQIQQVTH